MKCPSCEYYKNCKDREPPKQEFIFCGVYTKKKEEERKVKKQNER
jgi:hypothetical protein